MSKKQHKKQKRERHFARYAAKFWRELEAAFAVEGIEICHYRDKKASEIAPAILAKQLYGFADHVTSHMAFTFVKDIPDVDEEPA